MNRPVVLKRVPARLDSSTVRAFLRDIQPFLLSDCPRIVLDFSLVEHMDSVGIEMLIDCMSRCMQQDGDLKLASLSAHSATVLELTRTDRLFDIYESSTEAVLGFSSFVPGIASVPQTMAA